LVEALNYYFSPIPTNFEVSSLMSAEAQAVTSIHPGLDAFLKEKLAMQPKNLPQFLELLRHLKEKTAMATLCRSVYLLQMCCASTAANENFGEFMRSANANVVQRFDTGFAVDELEKIVRLGKKRLLHRNIRTVQSYRSDFPSLRQYLDDLVGVCCGIAKAEFGFEVKLISSSSCNFKVEYPNLQKDEFPFYLGNSEWAAGFRHAANNLVRELQEFLQKKATPVHIKGLTKLVRRFIF
jgi:hypothetical protein